MIFLTSLFTLKKRKCGVIGFYLGDNGVSDNLPSVFFFKLAIKIETCSHGLNSTLFNKGNFRRNIWERIKMIF